MDEPKGIVYVDIPRKCDLEVDVAKAVQNALGWSPDQVIDSSKPASLEEVLQVLSHHAIKYKQEYKRVPVLIIDNANRLAQKKQELLDHLQDYAKDTADKGTVTVVFVSSEGRVPRHMMGKSIIFIVLVMY
jgi:chromosomal replication initiation ATPase DnaA